MIQLLQQYEKKDISNILSLDNRHFKSLDVDYYPPHVERISFIHDNYRLYFHVLHPCKSGESLYHSHPWESVIHVLQGTYEMGLSFSTDDKDLIDVESGKYNQIRSETEICKIVANKGMYYQMLHKHGWHYVRPIGSEPCYSVMMTGNLLYKGGKATYKLKGLTDYRITEIKEYFYHLYQDHLLHDENNSN